MSKDLRDGDYLEHILGAISRINRYVADGGKHALFKCTPRQPRLPDDRLKSSNADFIVIWNRNRYRAVG